MSEYVYIAKPTSSLGAPHYTPPTIYRIGQAREPLDAMRTLESYWPVVSMILVHTVRADGHAGMLLNFLRHRFQGKRWKSEWYSLTAADIEWFSALTPQNFADILPEVSTKITPVKKGMEPETLNAQRDALLAGIVEGLNTGN